MASTLSDISFADMRAAMVDCQLRTSDVIDPAIVSACGRVARENFVPPALAALAYIDRPLAIGGDRRINAPLVTARLLVAADIAAGHRVLLIGAATGYCAALLDALGADVVAVECEPALAEFARAALGAASARAALGAAITLVEGPLAEGAPGHAPFDRIVVDGAIESLPAALTDQLAEGGVLVTALAEGAVTRLARAVKVGGMAVLRPFADMDAVMLPGFAAKRSFQF